LAAQSLAIQVMERARAATWDTQSVPPIDNASNVPSVTVTVLDLPIQGTNAIYATNVLFTTNLLVTSSSGSSGVSAYVKMISVTTTWPWQGNVMTNTMVAYRAPDQ
jgi:hypothetical protein